MTVSVLKAGLSTSVQAGPRRGFRHLGVPSGGAADPLSLALANRLVGNAWNAAALEVTGMGPTLRFDADVAFAMAGAPFDATVNGVPVDSHRTLLANSGDVLKMTSASAGVRSYVAVAGGFDAEEVLGSASTYVPGEFGGHEGRALRDGDVLPACAAGAVPEIETPAAFRPPMGTSWSLRTCESGETHLLNSDSRNAVFGARWRIGRRADRMGMQLEGSTLAIDSDGRMPSAGVYPGTLQCTESGLPFLLSADSGTTGGYPRVAQIARCDRHLLGQLRSGDSLSLLERTVDDAARELAAKLDYWQAWLPEIHEIL